MPDGPDLASFSNTRAALDGPGPGLLWRRFRVEPVGPPGCPHGGHRRSDTSRRSGLRNIKKVARVSLLRSGFQRRGNWLRTITQSEVPLFVLARFGAS